jgi:hypothetical protein
LCITAIAPDFSTSALFEWQSNSACVIEVTGWHCIGCN